MSHAIEDYHKCSVVHGSGAFNVLCSVTYCGSKPAGKKTMAFNSLRRISVDVVPDDFDIGKLTVLRFVDQT